MYSMVQDRCKVKFLLRKSLQMSVTACVPLSEFDTFVIAVKLSEELSLKLRTIKTFITALTS